MSGLEKRNSLYDHDFYDNSVLLKIYIRRELISFKKHDNPVLCTQIVGDFRGCP